MSATRAAIHPGRTAWAVALSAAVAISCNAPPSGRRPRDAALQAAPVTLFPAADSTRPPRAVIFFFGNDVGFWRPHQRLAWQLSARQFAVAGFDIRRLLGDLPDRGAARDSVFARRITTYVSRARQVLGDSVPLVLAGHSLGSELALWTAAHVRLPGLVGVLAMSPGHRSHLAISASDLLMTSEPVGPRSFAVATQVAELPPTVRLAIVRGQRDALRDADSTLLASGGTRARRWVVPFAGHSLKDQLLAPAYVLHAVEWLMQAPLYQPALPVLSLVPREPRVLH